jgi:putative peptidoglycan lipid II flippase
MSEIQRAARSALIIIIITLISKLLGFVREMVIAAGFGASSSTDAYLIALTIPAVLFASCSRSVQTAFIPLFNEMLLKESKEEALKFSNSVINIVSLSLFLISGCAFIFMPQITMLLSPGFKGEIYHLAIILARIMIPVGFVWGIVGISNGLLNSLKIFSIPAAIGISYNLVIIVTVVIFGQWWGIKGLALGTALGVLSQYLIQIPCLKKSGYRWRSSLNLKNPVLKKMGILVLPILASNLVLQLNVVVDRLLASKLPEGSISALNFANRLNGFVLGIFVLAFTTVLFPTLSQKFTAKKIGDFTQIFTGGIRIIMFLTFPAMMIIIMLKVPIISMLFERGAFDRDDTLLTAGAFLYYGLGLVAFGLREIINVTFYALQDTRTPVIFETVCLGLNMTLNIILVRPMAHRGLALATSISCTVYVLIMLLFLHRKIKGIDFFGLVFFVGKMAAASAVMALSILFGQWLLPPETASFFYRIIYVGGLSILGCASFIAVSLLLKVEEIFITCRLIREKIKLKEKCKM